MQFSDARLEGADSATHNMQRGLWVSRGCALAGAGGRDLGDGLSGISRSRGGPIRGGPCQEIGFSGSVGNISATLAFQPPDGEVSLRPSAETVALGDGRDSGWPTRSSKKWPTEMFHVEQLRREPYLVGKMDFAASGGAATQPTARKNVPRGTIGGGGKFRSQRRPCEALQEFLLD